MAARTATWYRSACSDALQSLAGRFVGEIGTAPPGMVVGVLRCCEQDADAGTASFEAGCAGQRQVGNGAPCELADRWHLGSDTKAFTATLAAVCIEAGQLRWDTTISDALMSSVPEIHAAYREVTLLELLSNTGGAPGAAPADCWAVAWDACRRGGAPCSQRMEYVRGLLALPPGVRRGEYEYSNQGFAIAGHMLETVTRQGYEEMMFEKVLTPLGITTAGFGAVMGADNPWGHEMKGLVRKKLVPKNPVELNADNPTAIAPAGCLHMSLSDWGRFIAAVVSPQIANQRLGLPRDAWLKLQAPRVRAGEGQQYGLGWLVVQRPWAVGGTALTHNGSNTMNYCSAWVVPAVAEGDEEAESGIGSFAVLVASNAGSDEARVAVGKACTAVIQAELAKL